MNALQDRDLDENEPHRCRVCDELGADYNTFYRRWLHVRCEPEYAWKIAEADGGDDGE